MSLLKLFRRPRPREQGPAASERGILVFDHTGEVIRAESLLKAGGWEISVKGPPPELRTGCDLVIEFPLIQELAIVRALSKAGLRPLEAVPVNDPLLQPVDIFQVRDFGLHIMVRAANMKITVEKESRSIVNVSGGGCPDVPYLAKLLVGRKLDEASDPREAGHTLCGYALALAYEEVKKRC